MELHFQCVMLNLFQTWTESTGQDQIFKSWPDEGPATIPPDYSQVLVDSLRRDIPNSFSFFDNEQDKGWWRDLLEGHSEGIICDISHLKHISSCTYSLQIFICAK